MNFKTAVKHSFKTALQFNTRASRSEYWNFALFTVLVTFAATVLDKMLFNMPVPAETGIISLISALILFIPGLSLMIKRLHDLDRTGWWVLLMLVPFIGALVLLVWFCTKGTAGSNRFGPDPLADYIEHEPVV